MWPVCCGNWGWCHDDAGEPAGRTSYDLAWLKAHSELRVAAMILVAGLLVLVDSLGGREAGTSSDPLGANMRRYGLPVLPAIIGVILGPDAELQLRRALQISDGDWTTLVSTPLSVVVYVIVAALFIVPAVLAVARRSTRKDERVKVGSGS